MVIINGRIFKKTLIFIKNKLFQTLLYSGGMGGKKQKEKIFLVDLTLSLSQIPWLSHTRNRMAGSKPQNPMSYLKGYKGTREGRVDKMLIWPGVNPNFIPASHVVPKAQDQEWSLSSARCGPKTDQARKVVELMWSTCDGRWSLHYKVFPRKRKTETPTGRIKQAWGCGPLAPGWTGKDILPRKPEQFLWNFRESQELSKTQPEGLFQIGFKTITNQTEFLFR